MPELLAEFDSYDYEDEATRLLAALYREFDFRKALGLLPALRQALEGDCFLGRQVGPVIARLREAVLATKFRLESRVRLAEVEDILGVAGMECQKALLAVLRKAFIKARVDMRTQVVEVEQGKGVRAQIEYRLREAQFRSQFRQ